MLKKLKMDVVNRPKDEGLLKMGKLKTDYVEVQYIGNTEASKQRTEVVY